MFLMLFITLKIFSKKGKVLGFTLKKSFFKNDKTSVLKIIISPRGIVYPRRIRSYSEDFVKKDIHVSIIAYPALCFRPM